MAFEKNKAADDNPPQLTASQTDEMPESPHPRRRWFTHLLITAYLVWLGHGVVSHALQYRANSHPLMYFTVWDMFCGWDGWAYRRHVVAEGESGQFYELTPAPWGEYHPFGHLGRQHYDSFRTHVVRIGLNCLKHTQHERMTRLYTIEETWSKKFNLPDPLWDRLHEEPKQINRYFYVKAICEPDGTLVSQQPSFHENHTASWLAASLQGRRGGENPPFLLGSDNSSNFPAVVGVTFDD